MTKSEIRAELGDCSNADPPGTDADAVSNNDGQTQVERGFPSPQTTEEADESVVDAPPNTDAGNSTRATSDDELQRPSEEGKSMQSSTNAFNSDSIDSNQDAAVKEAEDVSAAAKGNKELVSSSTKELSKPDNEFNKNDSTSARDKIVGTCSTNANTKTTAESIKHQPKSKAPIEQDFDADAYLDKNDALLTMSFNQDGGCLAIGTASGFRICNVHPFQETFRRNLGFQHQSTTSSNGAGGGSGGIARIEMLYRTNLLALIGHHSTASHSQYPPNKVLIYDDHSQRTIGELSFRQKILVTKLRRDRIVVVLRDRVYVYNFSDLTLLDKVHTGDNPAGLIGLSLDNWGVGGGGSGGGGGGAEKAGIVLGGTVSNNSGARNGMVLACPSTQRGQVRVELYGLRRTTFVDAHESALGALALSVDGSLLATASERGTVVRLYDTRGVTVGGGRALSTSSTNNGSGSTTSVSSSVPLKEFRRGVERATISCLTFSLDSCWLGCASDHGTVHIFQVQDPNSTNDTSNKSKPRSSMTGKAMQMLPRLVSSPKKFLMDGEHSYAQVRGVPHPRACAFVPGREHTIAVAGTDDYDNGVLLLSEFGSRPSPATTSSAATTRVDDSEAKRIGYHRFFKKGGAASMHGRSNLPTKRSNRDGRFNENIVEGGAYVDDNASVNLKMNHIRIGDENEDDFVPIDYDMEG